VFQVYSVPAICRRSPARSSHAFSRANATVGEVEDLEEAGRAGPSATGS
jgi:hypothetical protein